MGRKKGRKVMMLDVQERRLVECMRTMRRNMGHDRQELEMVGLLHIVLRNVGSEQQKADGGPQPYATSQQFEVMSNTDEVEFTAQEYVATRRTVGEGLATFARQEKEVMDGFAAKVGINLDEEFPNFATGNMTIEDASRIGQAKAEEVRAKQVDAPPAGASEEDLMAWMDKAHGVKA